MFGQWPKILACFSLLLLGACGSDEASPNSGAYNCPPLGLEDCFCDSGARGVRQCDHYGYGYGDCICASDTGYADSGTGSDATLDMRANDGAETGTLDDIYEDATDGGACVEPNVDCVGELPAPSCVAHILSTYQWGCDELQQCVLREVSEPCAFGCAPPTRGAACARLAYSTDEGDAGDLCVIHSLDDPAPVCVPEPGRWVAWHPTQPDRIAYTTLTSVPWVVILELGKPETTCNGREPGRDEPTFASGAWLHDDPDQILLFRGAVDEGYAVETWTFQPAEEPCLARETGLCPYASGDAFTAEPEFVIIGGATSDGQIAFTNRRTYPNTVGSLAVQSFAAGCDVDLLLEREGVTAVGWFDSSTLRYVSNGSLYHYAVGTLEPIVMVDPQSEEWSRGQYAIVDFNHDATVFAAISTYELDDNLYFFRRPEDGDPEPWPEDSGNSLTGPILWPSFERFESSE